MKGGLFGGKLKEMWGRWTASILTGGCPEVSHRENGTA